MSRPLALLAVLLCAGPGSGARADGEAPDWPAVWEQLRELRQMDTDDAGFGDLFRELRGIGREQRESERGRLLLVQLRRVGPLPRPDATMEPPAPDARPFEGIEHWLAAEVLEPGPARAREVAEGLRAAELGPWEIELAYRLGIEDAEALRLGDAIAIQRSLHERQQAVWTALNLALTLGQAGRFDEADELLAAQLGRGEALADLWNLRGLLALGRGDEARARDHLGRALALGSRDAAVVLGRLDLEAGQRERAAAQFRALLVQEPDPGAWALRGWGLTLLEPAPAPATPATATTDQPRSDRDAAEQSAADSETP